MIGCGYDKGARGAPSGSPGRRVGARTPGVYEALGRAIKTARAERGIERKDLAAATSLSYAYLSDIESGRRRPSSSAIFEIARALEMNPSELMLWTEQLTNRIASEESAAETTSATAPGEPLAAVGFAAPAPAASRGRRRSWFAASLADVEPMPSAPAPRRMNVRADLKTSDPRASLRVELERALDNLGAEDLELRARPRHPASARGPLI